MCGQRSGPAGNGRVMRSTRLINLVAMRLVTTRRISAGTVCGSTHHNKALLGMQRRDPVARPGYYSCSQ